MRLDDFKDLKISTFRVLVLIYAFWVLIDHFLFWEWSLQSTFVPISVLSFLPRVFLESLTAAWITSVVTGVGFILWGLRVQPRLASVISTVGFALAATFYLQNLPFGDHRQSILLMLLGLLTWTEFSKKTDLFFVMAGTILCCLYFFAGWEKIFYSGLSWINGTGLQAFAHYLGRPESFLRQLLLDHRSLAQLFQGLILLLECGVLVLFIPGFMRWFFISGLLGFHIGLEEIFFYRFFPHYILLFYIFGWNDLLRFYRART